MSRARARPGVSTYVEVFVLGAIAGGGSAVVFSAASAYAGLLRGPSVSILGASITQGPYLALERVTVYNSGQVPLSSFTVSTSQAPDSASVCYLLLDPRTMTSVGATCPSMANDPGVVAVAHPLPSASALLVELMLTGGSFRIGATSTVTVTTSAGAQATQNVVVGAL